MSFVLSVLCRVFVPVNRVSVNERLNFPAQNRRDEAFSAPLFREVAPPTWRERVSSLKELSAMDLGDDEDFPETPRKASNAEPMVKKRPLYYAPIASTSEVTINSF